MLKPTLCISIKLLEVSVAPFKISPAVAPKRKNNQQREGAPFISREVLHFSQSLGWVPSFLSKMPSLCLAPLPQNAVIQSEAAQNLQLQFPKYGVPLGNSLLMKQSETRTLSKLTSSFSLCHSGFSMTWADFLSILLPGGPCANPVGKEV